MMFQKNRKMKIASLALAGSLLFAVGPATAASAAVSFGAKNCTWPTHAFIEATTTGWTTMQIKAGNGTLSGKGFGNGSTFARNYLNSADEDAQWGEVNQYTQLQSAGMGCSI